MEVLVPKPTSLYYLKVKSLVLSKQQNECERHVTLWLSFGNPDKIRIYLEIEGFGDMEVIGSAFLSSFEELALPW